VNDGSVCVCVPWTARIVLSTVSYLGVFSVCVTMASEGFVFSISSVWKSFSKPRIRDEVS